jgi:DNA-binding response OmpR family regulator
MAAVEPMEPTVESALAGCRILIVEDEYFLADDFRQIFAARGAEVLGPVATLCEGLRIIESPCQIDFALLDVQLQDKEVLPSPQR